MADTCQPFPCLIFIHLRAALGVTVNTPILQMRKLRQAMRLGSSTPLHSALDLTDSSLFFS